MTELDVGPVLPGGTVLGSTAATRRLLDRGARGIAVRQGGYVVDPSTTGEPIRVGRS